MLAVLIILPLQAGAAGEPLRVAVAANFLGTLRELAPLYERAAGVQLLPSAGSSGELSAQIRAGAPYDVFLSADAARPRKLLEQGLAVRGSRFTYAIGTLVLWSPHSSLARGGAQALAARRYRFLSIANPMNAPYGAAAEQVLRALRLWEPLQQAHQLVMGENITQAWQFAATGNAQLAFVALSQVNGADGRVAGAIWAPPPNLYDPIEQDAVLLTHARDPAQAQAFLKWLRDSPAALARIHSAGYRTLH